FGTSPTSSSSATPRCFLIPPSSSWQWPPSASISRAARSSRPPWPACPRSASRCRCRTINGSTPPTYLPSMIDRAASRTFRASRGSRRPRKRCRCSKAARSPTSASIPPRAAPTSSVTWGSTTCAAASVCSRRSRTTRGSAPLREEQLRQPEVHLRVDVDRDVPRHQIAPRDARVEGALLTERGDPDRIDRPVRPISLRKVLPPGHPPALREEPGEPPVGQREHPVGGIVGLGDRDHRLGIPVRAQRLEGRVDVLGAAQRSGGRQQHHHVGREALVALEPVERVE